MLWFCAGSASARAETPPKLLTSVRQVHGVSAADAATHIPVHLRGVVTLVSDWPNAFFFQDASGAISVEADKPTGVFDGAEVEVTGETAPGLFAPIVHILGVRVLGKGKMPFAPLFTYAELTGGSQDCVWITMRGVVRSVKPDMMWGHPILSLQIESDGELLGAAIYQFNPNDAALLVDAKVRMQGVQTTSFNDKRQFTGIGLTMPSMANIKIEEPAPLEPFSLPLVPVRDLLAFKPGARLGHRVRVTGRVTFQDPGNALYLQDGADGVLIQSDQQTSLALGTRIEAVGFPSSGSYAPTLRGAVFRAVGGNTADAPVAPVPIHGSDFLRRGKFITAPYDAQLIRIQGQLVETTGRLHDDGWLLRDGNDHFMAILQRTPGAPPLPVIQNGSTVSVTGILSVQVDETHQPSFFRVLLRSPADIVVIKHASWWSPQHALGVLSAVLIVTLSIALWGATLRRTVRQQTQMLRESEERFRNQAHHDALTGLVSRSFLCEQLHEAIRSARFSGEKLSVLMVDLDFFKQINDTLGHHAGDELLRLVADRLRAAVRKTDVVARMGGDEFVVLLHNIKDAAEAAEIGAKVVASISAPAQIVGRPIPISASVGVCIYPDGGADADCLLQNVDAAMYKAKAEGRNSCAVYSEQQPALRDESRVLVAASGR